MFAIIWLLICLAGAGLLTLTFPAFSKVTWLGGFPAWFIMGLFIIYG